MGISTSQQFLRIKKLTGKDIVRVAARHNLREIQAEIGADKHIDHARIGFNQVIAGAGRAAEVAAYAEHLMLDAGVGNLRRDAVRAVEVVFGLPTESVISHGAYFSDSLAWIHGFFRVTVLSAVIHLDESAPHCHVLLLPLVDGRMAGSDLVGNKKRLQAMQLSFYEQVGSKYGLVRPRASPRLNQATRKKAASMVMTAIQGNPELLDRPEVEGALLELLGRDPEPVLAALGLSIPLPGKAVKSFAEIMTKPCKPEKPIGFSKQSKPIGFAMEGRQKHQTLSCVGFAPEESINPDVFTRCRDDVPSEYWDGEQGEYRTPHKAKLSAVRDSAIRELNRGLERMRRR